MGRIKIIGVVTCLLFLLQGCYEKEKKAGKPLHYLFIMDDPGASADKFETSLTADGVSSIVKEQPSGISSLRYTIFVPQSTITRIELELTEAVDDKTIRREKLDLFLDALRSYKGKANDERFILKSIATLLSEIADSNATYKIIFFSDMIEYSGGSNTTKEADWQDGNFHFSDKDNNCSNEPLDAARNQIKDPKCWIYKNIIAKSLTNPLLKKQHIYFFNQGIDLHDNGSGCDGSNVASFWKELFEVMDLPYTRLVKTLEDELIRKEGEFDNK